MNNLFLAALAIMILSSCKTEDDSLCCDSGDNISISIDIIVVSDNGIDLLNPENPEAFQEHDIRVFDLIDGETSISNNTSNGRGFLLLSPSGTHLDRYMIRIFANLESTDDYPINYIQWNENETDKLKAEFDRGDNYDVVTKVWFNDELVWDLLSDGDSRRIEIIK
ncbi:MAG: hypothetical protein OCD76_18280 [Reichenbachiella sp.]